MISNEGKNISRTVAMISEQNSEKRKRRKNYKTELKCRLTKTSTNIIAAIKEDKDDETIIELMYKELEDYINNKIANVEYEELLYNYIDCIAIENAELLYPNSESIIQDYRVKMTEEIEKYAKEWINYLRLRYISDKTNSTVVIANMLKMNRTPEEIWKRLVQLEPNVESMINYKNAVTTQINKSFKEKEYKNI